MKMRLLPFFIALTYFASAQKIEQYYDYNWNRCEAVNARYYSEIEKTDSGWHRRDYFIHEGSLQMDGYYADQDCKTANGLFYYFHPNRSLQSTGSYVNDKKEAVWIRYYPDRVMSDSVTYLHGNKVGLGMSWHNNGFVSDSSVFNEDGSGVEVTWFDNGNPSSAGRYSAGYKQHGKWQYFHRNGKLSAVEIYNEGAFVAKTLFTEDGTQQTDTTSLDREASFPGGPEAWKKFMLKHLWFPEQYQITNADKAVVVVTFTIDEDGNLTDAALLAPFHPAFDKIALNMLSKSPKWIPAIQHNRRVKYRFKQQVTFQQ
ncbi:MAG TPA: energy transducer TonB [Panacibacter sp.]|nr:energy transducer TonB [Panacibacter sp.]HNP43201.1 energy transducer TonB [Panacibacter sp.]